MWMPSFCVGGWHARIGPLAGQPWLMVLLATAPPLPPLHPFTPPRPCPNLPPSSLIVQDAMVMGCDYYESDAQVGLVFIGAVCGRRRPAWLCVLRCSARRAAQ